MLEEENRERERERENAKPEDRSTLAMARLPYNSFTVACNTATRKETKESYARNRYQWRGSSSQQSAEKGEWGSGMECTASERTRLDHERTLRVEFGRERTTTVTDQVKESEKIEGEYLETERDAQGGRSETTAETAETVD